MSLAQEGAYIRLLAYAWMDEDCAIPNDPEKLCRMLRINRDEWDKGSYSLVISNFQVSENDPHHLVNARLLLERQKQSHWREKCVIGGQKSAAKRWGAKGKVDHKGSGKGSCKGRGNYSVTLQFAVCSLHILLPPLSASDIYEVYPRRVGKPKAIAAIRKAEICPNCLIERVKLFAEACKDRDPQFIPHPATWFNQERYNDDPSTWKTNATHIKANPGGSDRNKGTHNEGREHAYANCYANKRPA